MEKKYCIWCGSEIKTDSKFCAKCGKKQVEEENQLVDWLISKTKDKLKGDAESSLIEAIKNFLLSHLYGTVMTISIIAASAVTIYAGEPYISKINADEISYHTAVEENSEYIPPVNREYDMDANSEIHTLCSRYLTYVNNENQRDAITGEVLTTEILKVPQNSGFRGVYEVGKDNRFSLTSNSYKRTEFDPALHTLDISKKMTSQGYNVGESVVEEWSTEQNGIQCYRKILFSFVEIDGRWLIAENRILELEVDEVAVPGNLDQDYAPEFTLDGTHEAYRLMNYLEDLYLGNDFSVHYVDYNQYTAVHDMAKIVENGSKEAYLQINVEVLDRVDDRYSDIENSFANQGFMMYQTKAVLAIETTTNTRISQTYTVLFVELGAEYRILDTVLTEDAIIF